jgi:hypothetical protein
LNNKNIWKIQKKSKLNSENICKIRKKSKLDIDIDLENSEEK